MKVMKDSPQKRPNVFQVRLSDDEVGMIDVIGEVDGLTAASAIRQWIHRTFDALAEEKRYHAMARLAARPGRSRTWVLEVKKKVGTTF